MQAWFSGRPGNRAGAGNRVAVKGIVGRAMRISVIGLGKLGAPLAALLACKGFEVTGVDIDERIVAAVNDGRAPVEEPRLQEMMDGAEGRLSATTDTLRAVSESEVTFILVPTPGLAGDGFSLDRVLEVAEAIGDALTRKDDYHLVVLSSTVMPGATENMLLPKLEARSGKVCGRDFGLCYNPEFVALGRVINGLLQPDFVLIGESDERSGATLADVYRRMCPNGPPVARMSFVNAELAKLSVNTFITMRISYANMLAQICEKLPGADVDVVTAAVGLDHRIGNKYLRGAVGYGGPCFPHDNAAFRHLARSVGVDPSVPEAANTMNRLHLEHLGDLTRAHLPVGGTVGVLGLSYKADTPVVEGSPGIELIQRLTGQGVAVIAYDPQGVPNARAVLRESVAYAADAAECASRADVLVIVMPWEEFRALTPAQLKPGAFPTVIDCWRVLPREDFEKASNYVTLGTGPDTDAVEPKRRASGNL